MKYTIAKELSIKTEMPLIKIKDLEYLDKYISEAVSDLYDGLDQMHNETLCRDYRFIHIYFGRGIAEHFKLAPTGYCYGNIPYTVQPLACNPNEFKIVYDDGREGSMNLIFRACRAAELDRDTYMALHYNPYLSPRLRIKDVIFNGPATIVKWFDGTKTVVKCAKDEPFDPEKGLAMAICKKILGTNKSQSNFNDIFKKWVPQESEGEKLLKMISHNVHTIFIKE